MKSYQLVTKNVDVNEDERLSILYSRQKLRNRPFLAVLHFTVTTRYYGLMAIIIFLTGQGSITSYDEPI